MRTFRLRHLALANHASRRASTRAAQGTFLPIVFDTLGTLPVVGPCLKQRHVARVVDLISGRKPRNRPPV